MEESTEIICVHFDKLSLGQHSQNGLSQYLKSPFPVPPRLLHPPLEQGAEVGGGTYLLGRGDLWHRGPDPLHPLFPVAQGLALTVQGGPEVW